jgi:hypothetical protein
MFDDREAARKAEQKMFLHEAAKNKAFNENQHRMVRSIQEINDRYNLARYGSR